MFRDRLAAEFAPYAALSDEQLGRLQGHYELLVKWNQSLNLTRIVDIDDAVSSIIANPFSSVMRCRRGHCE